MNNNLRQFLLKYAILLFVWLVALPAAYAQVSTLDTVTDQNMEMTGEGNYDQGSRLSGPQECVNSGAFPSRYCTIWDKDSARIGWQDELKS